VKGFQRLFVRSVVGSAALVAVIISPMSVSAGSPSTTHFTNQIQTFPSPNPCTGAPSLITVVQSGVRHFNVRPNGTVDFTETARGSFSIQPVDSNGNPIGSPSTGSFVNWNGGTGHVDQNGNPVGSAQFGFTLNGRGVNPDGTTFRFHNDAHQVFGALGSPKLIFFHAHCR
jgi:hypothetical protein